MIDTHGRKYVQPAFDKFAKVLIKLNLPPIKITLLALIIGLCSIAALFAGRLWLSAILLGISGIFDVLDGTVARAKNSSCYFGAFLDITFDRLIEIGIIIGLVFIEPELGTMLVVLTSAIVMSLTIFLTVSSFAKNNGEKITVLSSWSSRENRRLYIFYSNDSLRRNANGNRICICSSSIHYCYTKILRRY